MCLRHWSPHCEGALSCNTAVFVNGWERLNQHGTIQHSNSSHNRFFFSFFFKLVSPRGPPPPLLPPFSCVFKANPSYKEEVNKNGTAAVASSAQRSSMAEEEEAGERSAVTFFYSPEHDPQVEEGRLQMSSVPFSAHPSPVLSVPFRFFLPLPLLLLHLRPLRRSAAGRRSGEHSVVSELTPFSFLPVKSIFSPAIPLGFMAGCSSSTPHRPSPPHSPRLRPPSSLFRLNKKARVTQESWVIN